MIRHRAFKIFLKKQLFLDKLEKFTNIYLFLLINNRHKFDQKPFLKLAEEKGIVGIKGHRSVGGFRASIYNALPITSVYVLIDAMQEFAEKNK